MKTHLSIKTAFTMLELLFVIIVIGILAATIIPQTRTNPLEEAAVQLASDIRYTQHLALIDDTYDKSRVDTAGKVIWYKDRWQLVFSNSKFTGNKQAYTIFSDTQGNAKSRGDANEAEIAINPNNPDQRMTGGYNKGTLDYTKDSFIGMKKLNLGDSYGVVSVKLSGGCKYNRISFDNLGRPMTGDQSSMTSPYNRTTSAKTQRLIVKDCKVLLSSATSSVTIVISKETGYIKTNF